MSGVDRRGRLYADPFTYRVTKNGQVFISRGGRQVGVVSGERASRLIKELGRGDDRSRQLSLAKASGNYKRGNERR